jgi:hypothetical protein
MPYDPGISYHGDRYIYQGLSDLGGGISEGIDAFTKKHQEITIADEVMQQLAQTPDPSDPEGKRTVVDPKTYERFLAAKGNQRAAVAEGLLQKIAISSKLNRQATDQMDSESLRRYRLQSGNADMLRAQAGGGGMPTEAPTQGYKWVKGARGWYESKAAAEKPPDTKKLFGLTQAEFLDSTKTKRGFIVPAGEGDKDADGNATSFKGDPNGTYIQISGGTENKPVSPIMTVGEFEAHKSKVLGTPDGATRPQLSPRDQQAIEWAKANPDDPRSAKILQRLGL